MATISYHTLHGTQTVTLTEADLTGDDGTVATEFDCNGEMVAVPDPFPAEGVTCDFNVDGRYWTGFDRSVPVQAAARDMAWSGTAHALVAELGVGAATHSTLQLALGVAALLAGLGVVCTVMGVAFIWDTRRKSKVSVPDTIPEALLADTPAKTAADRLTATDRVDSDRLDNPGGPLFGGAHFGVFGLNSGCRCSASSRRRRPRDRGGRRTVPAGRRGSSESRP